MKNNYLYQGAYSELDDDIGWTDFALRNYDAQIGRWVQQDPYQEYASGYLAMGDDPVNLIDPSGGFTLGGLTKAGTVAVMTIGGAIIGTVVGLVSGDDDFTGTLIGAGAGLAAGLGSLIQQITANMCIQTASAAVVILNSPTNTSPAGGVDHIFSSNNVMNVEKNGTNSIYLIVDKIKTLSTSVDLNKAENRKALANAYAYYANLVGISMYVYGGVGTFGLAVDSDPDAMAYTQGVDVFINKKGNVINHFFSDISNTKSILLHERLHQDENKDPKFTGNLFTHSKVYLKQIEDPSFKQTTPKFQLAIIGEFGNYLMNAKEKQIVGVEGLVNDFNKNNGLGYTIQIAQPTIYATDMKVYIYQKGKLLGYTEFKKINE